METSRAPGEVGGVAGTVGIGAGAPIQVGRYVLAKELHGHRNPTFLATLSTHELFVVERLHYTPALARLADRLLLLRHPHLGRARELVPAGGIVYLISDYLDGECLATLMTPARVPLDVTLRALVDVLTGLSALHGDGIRGSPELAHGEVSPSNILLGTDGSTRLIHLLAAPGAAPSASAVGYVAPEVLKGATAKARADLYGVGAVLWEALTGSRLFPGDTASVLALHATGEVPRASAPAREPWAVPLVDVAMRALASDPSARFATAAEMAGEIRKIAKAKLALPPRVATYVRQTAGPRVTERRARVSGATAAPTPPIAKPLSLPIRRPDPDGERDRHRDPDPDLDLKPDPDPSPAPLPLPAILPTLDTAAPLVGPFVGPPVPEQRRAANRKVLFAVLSFCALLLVAASLRAFLSSTTAAPPVLLTDPSPLTPTVSKAPPTPALMPSPSPSERPEPPPSPVSTTEPPSVTPETPRAPPTNNATPLPTATATAREHGTSGRPAKTKHSSYDPLGI